MSSRWEIDMVMRYFRADVEPRGQGRPRFRSIPVTQGGKKIQMVHTYKKTDDKAYEKAILNAYLYTYRGIKPMEGPLAVEIKAWMPIPSSATRREKASMMSGEIAPTKKPDIDNIAKSVLDALNGTAWNDDKQVCSPNVSKQYERSTPNAGVEVWIREIEVKKNEPQG